MGKLADVVGKRFCKLVVLSFEELRNHHAYWKCKCDCGNYTITSTGCLKRGDCTSCGCVRKEQLKKNRTALTKHNMRHSKIYTIWHSMIQRCEYPKNISYKNYGAVGVCVCEEWRNSFQNFYEWAIKSGYKENKGRNILTIDRINPFGNYEPSNCRWATMKEQRQNTRKEYLKKLTK